MRGLCYPAVFGIFSEGYESQCECFDTGGQRKSLVLFRSNPLRTAAPQRDPDEVQFPRQVSRTLMAGRYGVERQDK
jgi:hypothetical protein